MAPGGNIYIYFQELRRAKLIGELTWAGYKESESQDMGERLLKCLCKFWASRQIHERSWPS